MCLVCFVMLNMLERKSDNTPNYSVIFPLFLFGLASAGYECCVSAIIVYTIPGSKGMGTAMGLMGSLKNVGLAGGSLLAGYIQQETKSQMGGYFWANNFYAGLSLLGIVLMIMLHIDDINYRDSAMDKVYDDEDEQETEKGKDEHSHSLAVYDTNYT